MTLTEDIARPELGAAPSTKDSTSAERRESIQLSNGKHTVRQRLARRLLHVKLGTLTAGSVTLVDTIDGTQATFGSAAGGVANGAAGSDLHATVRIVDGAFYTQTVARGTVGVGESYFDGSWTCDDLTALVRIFVRDRDVMGGLESGLAKMAQLPLKLLHSRNSNTQTGSKRNISAHYDLGNDFFERFLDPTMTYSCAFFETPDATLEEAQVAKLDRLCRKLDLRATDHLLEIGTGWGSMAMHAAREYGCRVTTTTISKEQHAIAAERIERAGLSDRITLLLQDYRNLEGSYDKLVSCEMVEAVGAPFLPQYLKTCASLLKPEGLMAMQAILITDQEYERALREVDFIKRYIFPGSFIPSMTAILSAATEASDLRLGGFDEIGPHYATTLRMWRERLNETKDSVRDLGYDDRFLRLWDFYLCYCEGGFLERFIGVGHIVLSKPGANGDHLVA